MKPKVSDREMIVVIRAKKRIADDPALAVYMCRDLGVTRDAGLDDLAWAIHNAGSCSTGDARGFFELLDQYIDGAI